MYCIFRVTTSRLGSVGHRFAILSSKLLFAYNIGFYFYTSNIIVDNKDIWRYIMCNFNRGEEMSGYLDIIFLLVLVVVIFSKLKSVLGTGARLMRK